MGFGKRNLILYVTIACAGGYTFLFLEHLLYSTEETTSCQSSIKYPFGFLKVKDMKTKVISYQGQSFKRLHDFCTWTPPSDCASIETPSGPVMVNVHRTPADDFDVSGSIFRRKVWDRPTMDFILSELNKYPDACFVDIGSNVGPFSLQTAKYGRNVLAIDPVFENVQKLCKSVEKNKLTEKVVLVLNPLSDEHDIVALDRKPPEFARTQVVKLKDKVPDSSDCSDVDMMGTVMLDDLIPLMPSGTAILKIDVESFEHHVMNGGKKFFEEIHTPSIIMEWMHVKKLSDGKALVELMKTLNFTAHEMKRVGQYIPLENIDYINWPNDIVWFKHEKDKAKK